MMFKERKNLIKQYQFKTGPFIIMIGALFLFISTYIAFENISFYIAILESEEVDKVSISFALNVLYMKAYIIFFLSVMTLMGSIISFKYQNIGAIISLIIGQIVTISPFVLIGYLDLRFINRGISEVILSTWEMIFDATCIIIGAIICFIRYRPPLTIKELIDNLEEKYGKYFDKFKT